MRKFLYILFCSFWVLGCSQKKENPVTKNQHDKIMYDINQYIFPEAKDITEANYIEKLNAQIKHYNTEPIYYMRINKQNCLIETYVNDVRDYKDYQISNMITPVVMGNILKSGKQKVTVKMYPVGNLNNESWGIQNGKPETHLSENSQVTVTVVCIDQKSKKGFDDEKVVAKVMSPKEAAGKEYYEFSFEFDALVPYEFEGWTKGQDLRKLDQELVHKKAVEFYQMCGTIFKNKELDTWLKFKFASDIRIKSSFFRDKQNLMNTLEEYIDDVQGDDYEVRPIENYNIDYMGDGRLLRLTTKNMNPDVRGFGILMLKYGKEEYIFQPGITLYLPEGRDLATQGFMMWK